jgi:hypothetical protein
MYNQVFLFHHYYLEVDLQVECFLIRLLLHKGYHRNHLNLRHLILRLYLNLQH